MLGIQEKPTVNIVATQVEEELPANIVVVIDARQLSRIGCRLGIKFDFQKLANYLAGDDELVETIALIEVDGTEKSGFVNMLRNQGITVLIHKRYTPIKKILEQVVLESIERYNDEIDTFIFVTNFIDITDILAFPEPSDSSESILIELAGLDKPNDSRIKEFWNLSEKEILDEAVYCQFKTPQSA